MITFNIEQKEKSLIKADGSEQKIYVEGTCLSTDTKPTDVANGSKMLEIDTSTLYCFDEENMTWRAW